MDDSLHPTVTDPEFYQVVFENDKVRVVELRDVPGARTRRHRHPDSVLITLSAFRRRMTTDGNTVEVDRAPFEAGWMAGLTHVGENVGDTPTHVLFVEIK
ncbi:cytoplasmic protein [Kitasatospora sp. NPDC056783]|uniref:cytoplasmic protein n=1 Tax=Kitasatospora sp. NPDC056783 TaxID=3345943 RepID=UPI0036CDAFB4